MQLLFAAVAFLLVASASAEQPQEVSNVQPVVVGQPQQGQVVPVHSVVEQPQVHQVNQQAGEQQHAPMGGQHYAPTGVIQVVGPQQQPQPQQYSAEQYGKPESASIPPNYKPFGSWGLYIGGNPADGYYSNYYKALGSSVDKQQVSGVESAVKPAGSSGSSGQGQMSAFGPMLKQASSYPYGSYADQVYPFDYYTPADLNSGSRVAVVDQSGPSVYAAGPISPVQVGPQVYGAPMSSYGSEQPMLAYADSYSTKRLGAAAAKGPERVQQQQQQQQAIESAPPKGYRYAQAPQQHYSAQPQVVAYPVPVGSQIVGSQPGTEGAYAPYGVHGYTRYAVKPTVVSGSSEQLYHSGVHSSPVSHFPVYKQQVVQPLGYYGYPLSQLHYSQGSIVPAFGQQSSAPVSAGQQQHQQQQAGPVSGVVGVNEPVQQVGPQMGVGPMMSPVGVQVEAAASDKSETRVEKKEQQKKA